MRNFFVRLLCGVGRQDAAHLVHPPGDGRFGDAEDRGGLGMRQLLPGDQHRRVTQRGLQPGDGALEPDRVIEVAAVRLCGQADQDRQPIGEGAERTAAAAQVPAGVESDPEQPGGEFGLAAIAADLFDQRAADVLGDVVGVDPRPGQLPGEAMDPVVMALQQLSERVAIAGTRGGDETGIWIAADIRPLGEAISASCPCGDPCPAHPSFDSRCICHPCSSPCRRHGQRP